MSSLVKPSDSKNREIIYTNLDGAIEGLSSGRIYFIDSSKITPRKGTFIFTGVQGPNIGNITMTYIDEVGKIGYSTCENAKNILKIAFESGELRRSNSMIDILKALNHDDYVTVSDREVESAVYCDECGGECD